MSMPFDRTRLATGCYRHGGAPGNAGDAPLPPVRQEREPHYGLDYWSERDKWIEQGRLRQGFGLAFSGLRRVSRES